MEDHKPLSNNNEPEIDSEDELFDESPPADDWPTWLRQNAVTLAIIFGLFVFLAVKFDGWGLLAIAKAALGLSFVIFIHEMGHLLVAKWCDVHVTSFSIGFGPTLPGCWFKWGETTYKLALIPIGGYVQMVGQIDGDESSDGSEDDPRSYRNKTVGQRMAIISAGVIMNVILAVVVFILVYTIAGKKRPAAVVGHVDSKSPCFVHGVKSGSEVTQIGQYANKPNFEDLLVTVLASQTDEKIPFSYQAAKDAKVVSLRIEPMMDADEGRPMIGMAPPASAVLSEKRLAAGHFTNPVLPGSPADIKSGPQFQFSDQIIGMTDPVKKDKNGERLLTPLPDDWRLPASGRKDYFEYAKRLQLLAGETVTIQVRRKDGSVAKVTVPSGYHRTLGARMFMGQVTSIRKKSSADGKIHEKNTREGDVIFAVDVSDSKGKTVRFRFGENPAELSADAKKALESIKKEEDKNYLDPMKLPYVLKRWAQELWQATKKEPSAKQRTVTLFVKRHTPDSKQYKGEKIELAWDMDWQFQRTSVSSLNSPLAIAELGFAYQVQTMVADNGSSTKLKNGDVIKRIRFEYKDENGELQNTKWLDLKDDQWAFAFNYMNLYQYTDKVTIEVDRDGSDEQMEFILTATPEESWPKYRRGLLLQPDYRLQKADGILNAVALGFRDTKRYMIQVYHTIRGMVSGRISPKNIGGPITIARAAYRIADYDFWEFLFFIGMISVNLAVINFLPIPVLDGGHFVFLLYEKIRGKPASENVRIGATYVGLVLILALFCFVFYIDIKRAFDL